MPYIRTGAVTRASRVLTIRLVPQAAHRARRAGVIVPTAEILCEKITQISSGNGFSRYSIALKFGRQGDSDKIAISVRPRTRPPPYRFSIHRTGEFANLLRNAHPVRDNRSTCNSQNGLRVRIVPICRSLVAR